MNSSYHNLYVVGGHKLATQYFLKLEDALRLKKLKAHEIIAITHLEADEIHKHAKANQILVQPIADFFYEKVFLNPPHPMDILVPDHTAKHILLMAFMHLAQKIKPKANVTLAPIEPPIVTPFLYPMENNALWAMSYATWRCPAECNEPTLCPHTQSTRDWDFNKSLVGVLKKYQDQGFRTYSFACESLFEEISFIPLQKIRKAFLEFEKCLNESSQVETTIIITHSHCHGITGAFITQIKKATD